MTGHVTDDVKRLYKLTWWALMLRGWFSIAVGVFVFVRPLESVAAFALLIAFWAIFAGLVEIMHALQLREMMKHWWVVLVAGLVSVGFGIAALVYYPTLALAFAIVWVAWWLTLTGVIGIYAAFRLRQLGMDWGMPAAFGVISVVAGVFALAAPPATLAAIMGLIAGFAIVGGIVLVAGGFRLRAIVHP